ALIRRGRQRGGRVEDVVQLCDGRYGDAVLIAVVLAAIEQSQQKSFDEFGRSQLRFDQVEDFLPSRHAVVVVLDYVRAGEIFGQRVERETDRVLSRAARLDELQP